MPNSSERYFPPSSVHRRMLLVRGILLERATIFTVDCYEVPHEAVPSRKGYSWTWYSLGKPGLSMLFKESVEAEVRKEWNELSTLCHIDSKLFDSMYVRHPRSTFR